MSATGPRIKRLGASGRRGEERGLELWTILFETGESRGTDQSSRALPPWVRSANMLAVCAKIVSVLFSLLFLDQFIFLFPGLSSPLSLRSPRDF